MSDMKGGKPVGNVKESKVKGEIILLASPFVADTVPIALEQLGEQLKNKLQESGVPVNGNVVTTIEGLSKKPEEFLQQVTEHSPNITSKSNVRFTSGSKSSLQDSTTEKLGQSGDKPKGTQADIEAPPPGKSGPALK